MKLKENVWYIIDREHDRNEFIDDLCCATRIMRTQMIAQHPEVQTAKVIKYKQKCCDPIIFDINYRTEFKPDYLQGPREHYEPAYKITTQPFDISTYKDNSILTSNVIKEWIDKEIAKCIMQQDVRSPNTIVSTVGPINIQDELEKFKPYIKNNKDNTLTKIYEGDNNMICSNEYNEKYLIQQYFNAEEKRLTERKIELENDLLKNTQVYKAAEALIEAAKANKGYNCGTPTVRYLIKDYLSEAQLNALSEINTKYNEEVEEVRKKCKVIESLINMCDNADQKMDILRRYEIIKLPKMPK